MKRLSELAGGRKGVIMELAGDARFVSRAMAMGLTVGCPVEVVQNEKGQPVLIYARDTLIALGRTEAAKIQIGGLGHECGS